MQYDRLPELLVNCFTIVQNATVQIIDEYRITGTFVA